MGSTKYFGYGGIGYKGKYQAAHRVSWEIHNGPMPDGDSSSGMCVLHKCDVPSCVNPDHLFLGTQVENVRDRDVKRRSNHCRGVQVSNSALTEIDVQEIKLLLKYGETQKEIAKHYPVSQQQISKIKLDQSWRHV